MGELPEQDPSARVTVLRETARTRVVRLSVAGRTVVCKQPLGPDAQRRLGHERAVLERLRGVRGVAQLVESPRYASALVLADAGDTNLAEVPEPLPADILIGVGLGLARAVAAVHRRGVLHGDITPANVVISRDGAPCLVDFALARSMPAAHLAEHSEIVGTLAYLAPEQTGRTGRSVDQRADLYSLGATLYELATGAPPFGSGDPLRLTHDHLAQVPVPPDELNPQLPAPLPEIISRLLEKEPDNRYQTADGVVHDLARLRDTRAGRATGPVRIGEHDFPLGLAAPPRLVGRDAEVAALREAFEHATVGRCRAVLVSGAAGVGKTALVDELRPAVTSQGGWFLAGKFDQYRRDLEFDGVYQAFRALGRLLLADPESELARVRRGILDAVGPNAGLLTAVVPEFAALLGTPPDPGDPLTAQSRAQHSSVRILRAVASRDRPVVLFLDDLQWAGRGPLGFVDLLLDEEPIAGLLLVGAQRDVAEPAALLSRARDQAGVRHLRLRNLTAPSLVAMVAETLRTDAAAAARLVEAIEPRTSGNPYETVQLLNALSRQGVLTASPAGWRWDPAVVRAHLGPAEVGDLLAARLEALPPPSRQLVEALACLGGQVETAVLQTATGEPAGVVAQRLTPALDEGLLVPAQDPHGAVRFRHDRIRESVLPTLGPRRPALHLAMARRLAPAPELFAVAADQYLPVLDAVGDPAERQRVAELLRLAADQAALTGDYARVSALLAAAVRTADPADQDLAAELRTARQAALFSAGRLAEAEAEYRLIEQLRRSTVDRAGATAVHVRSLSHQTRFAEAISLGLAALRECGLDVPTPDRLPAEVDERFDRLYHWLDHSDPADEPTRPDLADPALLAASRLIDAALPAAYFVADPALIAWLSLETLRIWLEHGPGPTLVGPASHAAYHAGAQRGAYSAGYRALQRIVALGEARGWEPGTSQARHMFAALSGWFEPIENGVRAARQARGGLIAAGDLAYAGYTYQLSVPYLADCAPTLENFVAEVDEGFAFLRRTGNEQTGQWLDSYRWLADVLRGESPAATGDPIPLDRFADNPLALFYAHLCHAVAAVLFGEPADLARHSAEAMALLPATAGFYSTTEARLLHGLALAEQARAAGDAERADLLSQVDEEVLWLAARVGDAPENFLHLLRLTEAERAWVAGDFRGAVRAFDAARREVVQRRRPWHRALIDERAARFHLAHGIEHTGFDLLARARDDYAAWGATAKVAQLDWAYPALRSGPDTGLADTRPAAHLRSTVTTGTLDLLGILSASQALSSETSIDRLHSRVVEVLSAMTGATGVHLTLWSDDRQDWLLPTPADADPGRDRAVPRSVLRYVRRTGAPIVVDDVTRDDRFAHDPCFADLTCCSLLAVPILSRGTLRGALLLENRLIRGAFTADRLDAVELIASQLAVSLDNAQLYAQLTASRARLVTAADQARQRIERDLHDGAQQRLVSLALRLHAARAQVPPQFGELATDLGDLATEAAGVLDELREIARGIHPGILDTGGLAPAVRALGRRSAIPVDLDVDLPQPLPEHVEVSAYFIIAEALTNAAKHARASATAVEVHYDAAKALLRIAVRDDGVGGADFALGTGLLGLKDRVEAIGGRIRLESPDGAGTSLHAELPLEGSDHASIMDK
ncbi:AAA family ATPase [Amycolatopsis sp. FDAARGOS 1241]|uniref:AAA family ATPase n=1 Tax=Amycolatopsis sp. FDAARGOS 1241 TaxID=2778070 RepID=UPI00194E1BC3|nr:AAA family ATPase [Amycolatopsis sp. FDAARGOS 1241]QRP46879.1 AAA family ATPase [Amycolatopsis sp. FDAARGOS 1241]